MSNTNSAASSNIDTLIGQSSVIKGELVFDGVVRIDGKFEGTISSKTAGTLIVSESAHLKAEVHTGHLILDGIIDGNVFTSESLKISATGTLNGDVQYKTVVLTEGATVNGKLSKQSGNASNKSASSASKDATAE